MESMSTPKLLPIQQVLCCCVLFVVYPAKREEIRLTPEGERSTVWREMLGQILPFSATFPIGLKDRFTKCPSDVTGCSSLSGLARL